VILARTVFDSLQEIVRIIWKTTRLLDSDAEQRHREAASLPKSFADVVLRDNKPQNADEIGERYALPPVLAQQYASIAPFFLELRKVRDRVIHGGSGVGLIYDTERGFCANPKFPPFSSFSSWQQGHYYNDNLVSIMPWVGDVILRTIDACNSLMTAFASVILLPPEIAPGYHIYVRGPHTDAVVQALDIYKGASPWWGDIEPTSESVQTLESDPAP